MQAEVAIVGAGPVGCTLAGLLGKRGMSVVVVERESDVFPHPRAAHIDHTGLRALQELGCLDAVLPDMIPNPGLDFVNPSNELLMRVPAASASLSGLPASMYFNQPIFDRVLRKQLEEFPGVTLLVETEVTSLTQRADGVTLTASRHDETSLRIDADWVVGCDGGSGPVRGWLGIDFEDLDFHERWLVVNLLLEGSDSGLPTSAIGACDPARPLYSIPMPAPRHRFEFMLFDDESAAEMQHEDSVRELISGWIDPASVEIERSAVYDLRGMVANPWQFARVLLAGDAAHQMPPFLGQGMCSGIRDAVNLAWKLDHVIRRGASPELLRTYTVERQPHVHEVATAAIGYGRLVCMSDERQAAERDQLFLDDPRPVAERITFRLPNLAPGPLVRNGGGELFIQPDVDGGYRGLDDLIGQRFFVLAREHSALGSARGWWEANGALVVAVEDLPEYAPALERWLTRRQCSVAVMRPDRYVLGAGDDLDALTGEVAELLTGAPYDSGGSAEDSRRERATDASALR